jgi:D-serine deaminase-like pyridoxal phosphate-dependent protein
MNKPLQTAVDAENAHSRQTPDTPAVVIEEKVMRRNIERVQARLDALGLANRPHIKTHRLARVARLQMQAGAAAVTCQKIGEAEVMADCGIGPILISYNIIGPAKLARLRALASRCELAVSADSAEVVAGLADTFASADRPLDVLVECDTGACRCGVQTPADAFALARRINAEPGLRFAGLMSYPPMTEIEGVYGWLDEAVRKIRGAGLDCTTVSLGGTPNLDSLLPGTCVTEHRPGTYVYNDRSLIARRCCTIDDCALTVLATVVSRPTETRAIIDAGSKSLSSDLLGLDGYGLIKGHGDAVITALSEEHGHVDLTASVWRPAIGDTVRVIPNHACVVSNLFDEVNFADGAGGFEAVRVDARGRSR